MTILEALKAADLFLKIDTRCMFFNKIYNCWSVHERQGRKTVCVLETESEQEAVAKLLEEDDEL